MDSLRLLLSKKIYKHNILNIVYVYTSKNFLLHHDLSNIGV